MKDDVKKLGKTMGGFSSMDMKAYIDQTQLCKMFAIIRQHQDKLLNKIYAKRGYDKDEYLVKRRALYEAQQWEEYEAFVKEQFMIERDTLDRTLSVLCKQMKIEEQIVYDSVNVHGKSPD